MSGDSRAYYAANKERYAGYRKKKRASLTREEKDEYNTYMKSYYSAPSSRIRMLSNRAIARAKKAGMNFDATLPLYLSGQVFEVCQCCKLKLDYSTGVGYNNRSPSLDRFDNTKGYTEENVRVICLRCNSLKKDASPREIEHLLKYMKGTNE